MASGDSIDSPKLVALSAGSKHVKPKPVASKQKVNPNSGSKSRVSQSPAVKPKASLEAIKKWKAKVAAQKALEKKKKPIKKKTTLAKT